MFNNVGGKIKKIAKIFCWLGIIGSIIGGISMFESFYELSVLYGFLVMIVGSIISWLNSLLFYAFGELVEDIRAIRNKEGTTDEAQARHEAEEQAKHETEKSKRFYVLAATTQ